LIPQLSRVAFLWNSNNGSHQAYLDEWRALAPKLGLHLIFVDVQRSDQFESAFAAMMQERPDALSVTADAFHMSDVGVGFSTFSRSAAAIGTGQTQSIYPVWWWI